MLGSSHSFLISHPPLSSVNRLSIRLPPRISVSLENSDCLKLSLSGQGGRAKREDNHYGKIQVRDRLIRSVSSGGGLHLHLSFSRWGEISWEYNIICFLILRLPDLPKNIRVFWKLFSQPLKTEIIAHLDDGLEAGRTICFEWFFWCDPVNMPGSIWSKIVMLLKSWVCFKTWEL